MTIRQTRVNTLLVPDFTIFGLEAELGWRNGLSSGSFPQLDVSMPRPSRLSEGVLGKIPTDKEAQQDHTLKRLTHQGFPDGARRSAAVVARLGTMRPDLLSSWEGPFDYTAKRAAGEEEAFKEPRAWADFCPGRT